MGERARACVFVGVGGSCAKQKGKSECWGHPASFHHPCADEPTGDFLKALEVCKCEVFPAAILKHSRVTDLKLATLSPRSWVLSGIKRGWRGLLTHSGSVTRNRRVWETLRPTSGTWF